METNKIIQGDASEVLKTLPYESISENSDELYATFDCEDICSQKKEIKKKIEEDNENKIKELAKKDPEEIIKIYVMLIAINKYFETKEKKYLEILKKLIKEWKTILR